MFLPSRIRRSAGGPFYGAGLGVLYNVRLHFAGAHPMNRALDHLYIFAMVFLTAYSQVVMRWQVGHAGNLPVGLPGKIQFVIGLLLNPWVISGIIATFFAGVSWMLALTKFQISYAYPFTSLVYMLVLASGVVFFRDGVNAGRLVGTAVVMAGVLIIARL
jgi:drug/metabolite transporter (DMT)-like permease